MTRQEAVEKLKRERNGVCRGCAHPSMVGWCENHCKLPEAYDVAIEALAQPEIIYCKDCEYYGRKDKRRFYRGYDCLEGRIATIVPDRDFCSRAKKENR